LKGKRKRKNKKQETRNKKQETRNKKQETRKERGPAARKARGRLRIKKGLKEKNNGTRREQGYPPKRLGVSFITS
jgi:hypothetical protein